MPLGKVNDDLNITGDSLKDGQPITVPHEFNTPITEPHEFGNVIPVTDATLNSNPVTWSTPDPAHFGNSFAPSSPIVLFSSDFPDAGSWPLTTGWDVDIVDPGASWVSPNDVHLSIFADVISTYQTQISSKGGNIALKSLTANSAFGLLFTLDPISANIMNNSYSVFIDTISGLLIIRCIGGIVTYLYVDPVFVWNAGDTMKFSVAPSGVTNLLTISNNGIVIASVTDPTFSLSALYPSFEVYTSGFAWDFGSLLVTSNP